MEATARPTARSAAARRAHLTTESDPARQPLHLNALQVRVGAKQRTQGLNVQGHAQVVLDQHALGKRGSRKPHRALGRGNRGDLAAQRHPPGDTLHPHPVQPRLARHERAQRPEVQPNLQVVLDQHVLRDGSNREPDSALGSRRGAHLTTESDPARQPLHLNALQLRVGIKQCTQGLDIQGNTQVVLDQHALGKRGGR